MSMRRRAERVDIFLICPFIEAAPPSSGTDLNPREEAGASMHIQRFHLSSNLLLLICSTLLLITFGLAGTQSFSTPSPDKDHDAFSVQKRYPIPFPSPTQPQPHSDKSEESYRIIWSSFKGYIYASEYRLRVLGAQLAQAYLQNGHDNHIVRKVSDDIARQVWHYTDSQNLEKLKSLQVDIRVDLGYESPLDREISKLRGVNALKVVEREFRRHVGEGVRLPFDEKSYEKLPEMGRRIVAEVLKDMKAMKD